MDNLKDKLTSICGLLFVIAGAIIGVQTQVVLPQWIMTACIVVMAVSGAVTMYLSGKNPNGSTKSESQVAEQNIKPESTEMPK